MNKKILACLTPVLLASSIETKAEITDQNVDAEYDYEYYDDEENVDNDGYEYYDDENEGDININVAPVAKLNPAQGKIIDANQVNVEIQPPASAPTAGDDQSFAGGFGDQYYPDQASTPMPAISTPAPAPAAPAQTEAAPELVIPEVETAPEPEALAQPEVAPAQTTPVQAEEPPLPFDDLEYSYQPKAVQKPMAPQADGSPYEQIFPPRNEEAPALTVQKKHISKTKKQADDFKNLKNSKRKDVSAPVTRTKDDSFGNLKNSKRKDGSAPLSARGQLKATATKEVTHELGKIKDKVEQLDEINDKVEHLDEIKDKVDRLDKIEDKLNIIIAEMESKKDAKTEDNNKVPVDVNNIPPMDMAQPTDGIALTTDGMEQQPMDTNQIPMTGINQPLVGGTNIPSENIVQPIKNMNIPSVGTNLSAMDQQFESPAGQPSVDVNNIPPMDVAQPTDGIAPTPVGTNLPAVDQQPVDMPQPTDGIAPTPVGMEQQPMDMNQIPMTNINQPLVGGTNIPSENIVQPIENMNIPPVGTNLPAMDQRPVDIMPQPTDGIAPTPVGTNLPAVVQQPVDMTQPPVVMDPQAPLSIIDDHASLEQRVAQLEQAQANLKINQKELRNEVADKFETITSAIPEVPTTTIKRGDISTPVHQKKDDEFGDGQKLQIRGDFSMPIRSDKNKPNQTTSNIATAPAQVNIPGQNLPTEIPSIGQNTTTIPVASAPAQPAAMPTISGQHEAMATSAAPAQGEIAPAPADDFGYLNNEGDFAPPISRQPVLTPAQPVSADMSVPAVFPTQPESSATPVVTGQPDIAPGPTPTELAAAPATLETEPITTPTETVEAPEGALAENADSSISAAAPVTPEAEPITTPTEVVPVEDAGNQAPTEVPATTTEEALAAPEEAQETMTKEVPAGTPATPKESEKAAAARQQLLDLASQILIER